jgi:hypothetical protein
MNWRMTASLVGCAAALALAAPTYAAPENPIFGKAVVKINTPAENKAVAGKGSTADYYGYYGNLYNNYAGYYGTLGSYYRSRTDGYYWYYAYYYSYYATNNYYYAYYYQSHGS